MSATTSPARLVVAAALTLTATLTVFGATATTATTATSAARAALTSYVVPAVDNADSDTTDSDTTDSDTTDSDTTDSHGDQVKHDQVNHDQVNTTRHGHVLTPAGAYCKVKSSCIKRPTLNPTLVPATFTVTGSGTADSIVIDYGKVVGFSSESFTFTRTYMVDPNIDLLQVHESGAHQTSVGCTITLNGKLVSNHPTGADCVYNKN